MKRSFLVLALLPLSGCIWDPTSRGTAESSASMTIDGFAASAGATVTLSARNANTGNLDVIGTATADSTPTFTSPYPMYAWSLTLTPASNYWSPQSVLVGGVAKTDLNGLGASAGRIEISGVSGGSALVTFTAAAKTCVSNHVNAGDSFIAAGNACSDGTSVVVFDNNGVGNGAPATGWVTDYNAPSPPPGVAWEIGHYQVQGMNIYGLICRPTSAGTHKAVIINHGGYGPLDTNVLNTYCIGSAQGGWVTAISAYRGEQIALTGLPTYTSGGHIELCQGEVTDVLRLTDLVRARADVDTSKVLMWGHSHGACITERAVQRGALVKAAAAFSAPTDMAAWYNYCGPGTACDTAAPGNQTALATTFGEYPAGPGTLVTPSQSVIPYDWRSPVKYSADLTARTDVKFLLLQGGADPLIHPSQACELASASAGASSMNWHFNSDGSLNSSSPSDCSSYSSLTWQSSGLPYGTWPANRYLLVYDYADHGLILTGQAWTDFLNWVGTNFP